MSDDLVERLHEEGLGFGIGPAGLCQEAAARIEALTAENAKLREALRGIEDAVPSFDYASGPDFTEPGSPYDRGKKDAFDLLQARARAALEPTK